MDITLKGYKGKAGGLGLMLVAVGTVLYDIYEGKAPDFNAFATMFLAGLGILGIRLKMD